MLDNILNHIQHSDFEEDSGDGWIGGYSTSSLGEEDAGYGDGLGYGVEEEDFDAPDECIISTEDPELGCGVGGSFFIARKRGRAQ